MKPERRMTTQQSSHQSAAIDLGNKNRSHSPHSARKHIPAPGDHKFLISHNNQVKPNFQSQTYQIEAQASFKKRMRYNPMESAKKKDNKPAVDNAVSEYAQTRMLTTGGLISTGQYKQ